ncbi:hypothetical protein BIV24_30925 [Streptomyces colonosanans]|uniref:Uncharacterized protein n=1 Tax=Streptomyces colonosanans TaxID=1428652 RepID=A0A1S2NTP6_9ACTN|nr:hypothetical protein BIV24_30925 [Streptomyces colonosanans]
MVALLVLFAVWVVTSSGSGGGKNKAGDSNGKHPTSSITPGPSGSGPAISQHPGGRDESGDEAGSGTPGSSGSGDASGAADAGSGGTDNDEGGGSSGGRLAAGSGVALPNCTANALQLTLRSIHNAYAPGDMPAFELSVKNSSGSECKVDLGPKRAVLTITQSDSDKTIWSSADCPSGSGSVLYRVPAGGHATYTAKWDRKPSAPNCATPPAGSASAGTYLVEAKAAGLPNAQTSFVLSKD